ncbi:Uncharacterized protein BP5553_06490 [Venustampulla echinocandica]|uniref:Receptor L-domain domain-containing protein n=1 Tax=Venustampulla echinocandica TaxID=2656787 RepID=A0A370TK32_9HELO|nr:Uncharacterized protein BP5553_06490 [Venustampulla echinocandica]RDL35878.1 Uncharacterized protein BP5553_06490 [Venustampulla echinocandica]
MESRWRRRCVDSAVLAIILLAGLSNGDNCTSPSGFTIESQAAADALNNCSTITGDVNIQGNDLTQITLNGIEKIHGNLAASSCDGLQTISAPALSKISSNFTLSSLPLLASLNFPFLDNVNGGIYWDTLSELTDVSFGNLTAPSHELPGTNVDGDISISNTGISSLAFLNFTHYSNPATISIKGNQRLSNVNLTGLSWGSNSLAIVNNGLSAQIFLPDLRSVGAITIGNAGHIYIPSLSETLASMEMSNNTFNVFSAPNLTNIGGSLIVRNNDLLDDLSIPLLTSAKGGITVANNAALHMINDLGQLWFCQGNITLSGYFSNVTLPSLRNIIGGFHLNSSNPDFDCTTFDKLSDRSSWSSSFYSCGAYLPGSTKDLAKHYQAPDRDLELSKPVRAIIIILSVIAGLFLCALLMRLYVKKTRGRRGSLTRSGSRTVAGIGAEGDMDLEELGVTRSVEGDGLPKYRRVGRPGEVPPGYTPSKNVGANQVETGNVNTETLNTARVEARRRWIFW